MGSGIAIPTEILNEIIAYLWNDIPSLKACSLAHRSLTVLSQKRSFYTIGLRYPKADTNPLNNELTGTPFHFWRLLVHSPHIADYVQSLFITDYCLVTFPDWQSPPAVNPPLSDAEDIRALLYEGYRSESQGNPISFEEREGRRYIGLTCPTSWLANDECLPYCALRLQNLKAVALRFDQTWDHLSPKVYIALLRLMSLPSLLSVRMWYYPVDLFHIAIGDNVKHLSLLFGAEDMLSIVPEYPSTKRLYINSLELSCILNHDFKNPNCRIDMSRLRKLVIGWKGDSPAEEYYASIWTILQICCETLEEFELIPDTLDDLNPIDLSKLTSLKKFTINSGYIRTTAFRLLNRIILPPNDTALSVEDISIKLVHLPGLADLKKTFDALLDRRFCTLKKFSLFVGRNSTAVPSLVDELNGSEVVETLRSQRGVVVDIRACGRLSRFEPDVRWTTSCWKAWNHVDVHEGCLLEIDG